MSHASSLKTRRQRQKTRKLLDVAAKEDKRLKKQASASSTVKKEKVVKEKVVKEKVKTPKLAKKEHGKEVAKKGGAGAKGKSAT